jgi:hypothetical protein
MTGLELVILVLAAAGLGAVFVIIDVELTKDAPWRRDG